MRIFYASDTTPNSSFESNIWRNNLLLPMVDLGHEVIEFDYDLRKTFQNLNPAYKDQKKFIKKNRPKVSKALLEQIKEAHHKAPIDLFFSCYFDACITPETLEEIKSLGIKTVNWYPNGSYQLHLVSQISPHYDYCLAPEKFRIKDYKKLGANPIHCQEAANPQIYTPHDLPKEFDVTFVGQAYGDRPDYVKFLLDNKIDIRVWGINWNLFTNEQKKLNTVFSKVKKLCSKEGVKSLPKKLSYKFSQIFSLSKKTNQNIHLSKAILPSKIVGPVLSDNELIKLYSRSKINLGFSTCGNTHKTKERITQIRLRDFEVPMSGGFYMVEYMKELEEFFEIGKEVVCYHDKQDLLEKIKFYLKHDSLREKIQAAGRARCLKDHTWQKRFKSVFEQIFKTR